MPSWRPPGSFNELLQKLAAEHNSEVNGLRDENARLLAKLGSGTIAKEEPQSPSTLSPHWEKSIAGPRIDGQALALKGAAYSPHSLTGPELSDLSIPDEDALEAAFAVALERDEADEFEHCATMVSFKHDLKVAQLPLAAEWPAKAQNDEAYHNGEDYGCSGCKSDENFDKDMQRFITQRVTTQRSLGSKYEGAHTALGRWQTFINYAQAAQFVQSLPKVNPRWVEAAAEVDGDSRGTRGIADLATKSLKGLVKPDMTRHMEARAADRNLLSRTMWPFMMHPTSRRRVMWDMAGIALLLHDLIFIPFQVFENGTEGLGDNYSSFLSILDVFGASFWSVDIIVSFLTGYYSAEGFVELTPIKVSRHYCKSWFSMDLLIVSLDWTSMIVGMSSASGFMRLGKTVSRIMRVLRLFRFLKLNRFIVDAMERINSEYLLQMVNLLKTLVLIVVMNHYIACIWYAVGTSGFFNRAWPDKFLVNYPGAFTYAYSTALHWSLTQFTPASMEVVPQNAFERVFAIMVIILALVAFSSFVSSITAAMTHIRQINARQVAEEAAIRQFFSEHKVSHATGSRIWHYIRKNRSTTGKRMKEVDVPALKGLPHKLKEDLRLEVYMPVLGSHAFFEELFARDKATVQKLCQAPILTEKSIPVGEELFRGEGAATKMVFVATGQLQYIETPDHDDFTLDDEELGDRVTYVPRGRWACEAALWADYATLPGPFFAYGTGAEVILLDAVHFQNTIRSAGEDTVAFVAKYSVIFMDHFRDACIMANNCQGRPSRMSEDATSSSLLFNEYDRISKITEMTKQAMPLRQSPTRVIAILRGFTAGL